MMNPITIAISIVVPSISAVSPPACKRRRAYYNIISPDASGRSFERGTIGVDRVSFDRRRVGSVQPWYN